MSAFQLDHPVFLLLLLLLPLLAWYMAKKALKPVCSFLTLMFLNKYNAAVAAPRVCA